MAIKSGRYGKVSWDADGGSPLVLVELLTIDKFKLSYKTDKINVTCFGPSVTNKVYVPSLPDVSGTLTGFWDSTERALWAAAQSSVPGHLSLLPNRNESTYAFSGLAYLDVDLDTDVQGVPAVSGSFMAAGPWDVPE